MSSLDDLPDDLIKIIFHYGSSEELSIYRTVCQRWHSLIPKRKFLVAGANPQQYVDIVAHDIRSNFHGCCIQTKAINLREQTPTLDSISSYDAIFTWSGHDFKNSEKWGNVLADYIDQGGGVVLCRRCAHVRSQGLQGRFVRGGYLPVTKGEDSEDSNPGPMTWRATDSTPSHPLLEGVTFLDAGTTPYLTLNIRPSQGAHLVLRYEDAAGTPLLVVKRDPLPDPRLMGADSSREDGNLPCSLPEPLDTKRNAMVYINIQPLSSEISRSYYNAKSHFARLFANALLHVSRLR